MSSYDSWLEEPLYEQAKQELEAEAKEAAIREQYMPGGEISWEVDIDDINIIGYMLACMSNDQHDRIVEVYRRELNVAENYAREVFESSPEWLVLEIAKRDKDIMALLVEEHGKVIDLMVNREFAR